MSFVLKIVMLPVVVPVLLVLTILIFLAALCMEESEQDWPM